MRNSEIHLGNIVTIRSENLDVDRRALEARFVEDTGKIEFVNNRSRTEAEMSEKSEAASMERETLVSPRKQW